MIVAGCGNLNLFGNRSEAIGPRAVVDPMAAAEAYLRQYQPGPLPRLFQTTRVYDRHGTLLGETFGEGRRVWLPLNQISKHLIDATIATEDSTFYSNSGVDPARIAGAAIKNLQEGEIVSGASTITMQLARNLFLGPEQRYDQSVDRKVLEAGLAQELTDLYSKDELLEMYMNLLNYGQLAYGPESAAQVYFGKSASDLTLAEATLLAGIPQQPANLNPYDDFEKSRQRQRTVLNLMVRHGYLTEGEADETWSEPVTVVGDPGLAPNLAPHFLQYVLEQMDSEFGDGYTRRAGFKIFTTLDLEMQKWAESVVATRVAELRPLYDLSNAALVAMMPGSAQILVMVGSADFYDDTIAGQVNVALQPRQPGSAIKPVLYATAIEDNLISPATVLWDVPVTYTVGVPEVLAKANLVADTELVYRPRNYDDRFHGPVTARGALANSLNVPTVKLLDALGVDRMLEMARAMGLNSLNRESAWYGLSLTLGGGEVTLLDLSSAFHTLANEGAYVPPQFLQELRDSQDRIIEEVTGGTPVPVLAAGTAFLVTDMLSDNMAREPAFGDSSPLMLSRPAAAKTGTTTDWRDNWTVGYTRYLLTGVWAGNSDGRPMQNASGITGAAPIWHDFMEGVLSRPELLATLKADSETENWQFNPPNQVTRLLECPPSLTCPAGGEYFRTAWLELAGNSGALADSVDVAAAAAIFAQQGDSARLVGFCELPGAADHVMLRMPDAMGLPQADDVKSLEENAEVPVEPGLEQQHVIAWAVRNGAAVNLGRCDLLGDLVPSALALDSAEGDEGLRLLVDVSGANSDPAMLNEHGVLELAALRDAVAVSGLIGGGAYVVSQPIVNDRSCPGQYVMGQVLNHAGDPTAGVRVALRDSWGNRAEAVSKSGPADYGMFDFPIYADGPHDLFLTVVDEGGTALSMTLTIPHRQDGPSDTPCHHVVLRGG